MIVYDQTLKQYFGNDGSTFIPMGAGGGGGGGAATWSPVDGLAPVEMQENGEKVYLFTNAGAEKLCLFLKVPEGYTASKAISCFLAFYSASTSNTVLFTTTAYLIKKNTDAISSTSNSRVSTNTAVTMSSPSNKYRQATADITDGSGQINGQAVGAGDLIRIELTRGTDTDTAQARFVPSGTEFKFS